MDNQNSNIPPAPTLPNKDIFDASKVTPPVLLQNKQQVVSNLTGGRMNSNRLLFVGLGIFVLIVILVLGSVVVKNVNQNKEVKITWWSLEEDSEAVAPLIDEYKKQNPKVTINFVKQDAQDYRERLANAIARGQGPDIFEFHNSWVPMFGNNLVPGGDYSSTFYPVASYDLKSSKGFLGVPLEYDGIALFVNQDILHAYGKNNPKTWDDLRNIAKQLTVMNQDGTIRQAGVAMGVTSNVDYWQDILGLLMYQNGADLKNPSSTMAQSSLTFFTNFSKLDRVWDETLPNSSTYFSQGSLAMYFGKYSDAIGFRKNANLHFQVVPLPQLPESNSVSYASYWVNGVSTQSKNQVAAWDFLKFMMQKTTLEELYKNEVTVRGYGNLYPRVDMQSELLSDSLAGPFVYQGNFAKSWYLNDKTFDGVTGINSAVAKPFADAISGINGSETADQVVKSLQFGVTQVLAGYGLVALPVATP